jgi:RNA polymerase sigma-70 factor (ECF subfamily)
VYRTAQRVLGDPDLAADATQDAFVNAFAALDRFRGESSVRTWLLRIAVNAARAIGRRRGRRREVALEAAASTPAHGPRLDERTVMRSELDRVERSLARLPEKQRLCVGLRIQHDLSYAEIGEIAGCSEASARVNYHYGLQRLREVLGDDDAM